MSEGESENERERERVKERERERQRERDRERETFCPGISLAYKSMTHFKAHSRVPQNLPRPNQRQKRPTVGQNRPTMCGHLKDLPLRATVIPLFVAPTTCTPNQCQKRATIGPKETYYVRTFHTFVCSPHYLHIPVDTKQPVSKETYYRAKSDLL